MSAIPIVGSIVLGLVVLLAVAAKLGWLDGEEKEMLRSWRWMETGGIRLTFESGWVVQGSRTVWVEYPTGRRLPTLREVGMSTLWTRIVEFGMHADLEEQR